MINPIHEAFDTIHATEELKQNTTAFLEKEIQKRQRKRRMPKRFVVACCILVLAMLGGIGGYRLYSLPVSYISVDVNPSVELGLNQFDRVVEVTAYNDDAKQVLKTVNLENKTYTEAIETLLASKAFQNYLNEDAALSFTVVSDKEDEILTGIKQCHGYAEAQAQCHRSNESQMEEAHHSGLSFGKYQAYLELRNYDASITIEDCKSLSMHQIQDLINQFKNGVEEPSLSNQGQGHGAMQGQRDGNGYHGGHGNNHD